MPSWNQIWPWDCGGVGYACAVTESLCCRTAEAQSNCPALHPREHPGGRLDLFGFASREELRCFQLLLGVNGVGPSGSVHSLRRRATELHLSRHDRGRKALTVAQGVGKKLAQRIILELRTKSAAATELDFSGPVTAAPTGDSNVTLATAALQELGYSSAEIAAAPKGCDAAASTEEMIRYALRAMVSRS